MAKLAQGWKLLLAAAGFIILVLLIADFNNRMADLRRLSAEKEVVSAQVTSLVATQQSLETQVAYATSEAAVYKWAYTTRRMTDPNDVLIVPIQPAGSTPVPTPQPVIVTEVVENWQVWLSLFVDPAPVSAP
ncbi:MAG: hypothetical protein JW726_20085 [Anaerolineales bacterium]|nr:hypothetical protein [Anaerolineales bacterium]